MILNNQEILNLISKNGLIENAKEDHIKNCSYSITIGKVFEPGSGKLLTKEKKSKSIFIDKSVFLVKPTEIIILMSKEKINLPLDICATYNSTYYTSRQGLQLINNSIIEPGYNGYLSCIFVNFSKINAKISVDTPLVKLVFHKLNSCAIDLNDKIDNYQLNQIISEQKYTNDLAALSTDFSTSYLDIGSIESNAEKRATSAIKKQIVLAGIFISFLLLWSTLQPMLSKWIYLHQVEKDLQRQDKIILRIDSLESEVLKRDSIIDSYIKEK